MSHFTPLYPIGFRVETILKAALIWMVSLTLASPDVLLSNLDVISPKNVTIYSKNVTFCSPIPRNLNSSLGIEW